MPKEYYEDTKVESIPQKIEKTKVKSPMPKKLPNFDDKRYAIKSPKIEQQFPKREQEHLKSRTLLRSIPIIGGFLARTFTSEKIEIRSNPIYDNLETYKESQSDRASKTKDVADDKHAKDIGSKLEEGSVERAGKEKDHSRTK